MKHKQLKLNNKKIDVIYSKLENVKTEDEFEDLILNQVEFSLQSDDVFKSKFLGLLFHVVNGGRIGRFKWLLYDINNRVQKDKYFPFYYEVVDDYYLNENKFKTEADSEEQIEKDFVAFVNERMQKVKNKLSK